MNGGFEFTLNTGNPATDQQTLAQMQQQYQSAGMTMQAAPLPSGGFHVKVSPAGQAAPPQPGYGQGHVQQPAPHAAYGQHGYPQHGYPQQPGYGQPQAPQAQAWQAQPQPSWQPGGAQMAYAGAGAAAAIAGQEAAIPPLAADRVRYLRKVYSLLAGACFVALATGFIAISVGPTVLWTGAEGEAVRVPVLVSIMLGNDLVWLAAFGLLVLATMIASWVSKIPVINTVALFGVAAIMGVEIAPMVFVAQYFAGIGDTLTAAPVRDAGLMTFACFAGITGYVFVTRKDFSYLRAMLHMGFWVVLGACILAFVFKSEVFALAVATAGALLSAGFLLYVTSYIFKNSEMDDPVGDALALLVQLRNLFMFLLRIFMSSRS